MLAGMCVGVCSELLSQVESAFDRLHHLDSVLLLSPAVAYQGALGDVDDIKLLAHLMLVKLSTINAACILEGLEGLVPPMNATLDNKVKENATKQDIERNDELLRSCIRAVEALRRLGESQSSASFAAVLEKIQKDPKLKALLQSLGEDSGN